LPCAVLLWLAMTPTMITHVTARTSTMPSPSP
jgi:hypothetical protein